MVFCAITSLRGVNTVRIDNRTSFVDVSRFIGKLLGDNFVKPVRKQYVNNKTCSVTKSSILG